MEERRAKASDSLQPVKDLSRATGDAGALRANQANVNQIQPSPGTIAQNIVISVVIALGVIAVSLFVRWVARASLRSAKRGRTYFWTDQVIKLAALAGFIVALAIVWQHDLSGLGGALGVIGAGVAVALQRVITSFAGYLIILRGNLFTVGDRVTFGGVRGDVIALGFMQTTVLEMGQAPAEQPEEPAIWVLGRQYTGRMVRVTNDKIFDFPVYNYTNEFPFVWDEIMLPVHYDADYRRAEQIMLDAAQKRTADEMKEARPALEKMRKTYYVKGEIEIDPRVYVTVNDNYIELSLRYLSREPGVRLLKDALFRDILAGWQGAHISIASTGNEIAVTTPLKVVTTAE